MKRGKFLVSYLLIGAFTFIVLASSVHNLWAAEEKYPSRNIELFCGFAPGGVTDTITRFVGKKFERYLNTVVVPSNKPGGGEVIAASALANSPPDGYTLAILGDASLIASHLLGRATYKKEDLRVVGEFVFISNVLAVSAESPWKTIQEFIDYARKNPGITYSHPGVGTSPFVRVEYFNKITNLKLKGVPFRGDSEGIAAVLGKHVTIGVFSGLAAKVQEDAGKMRILFCFDPPGLGPIPNIPNIPSFFGKDVLDIDPVSNYLVAPGKTPDNIIKILETNLEKMTKDPEFIDFTKKIYIGVRFTGTNDVSKILDRKASQTEPILRDAGLIK